VEEAYLLNLAPIVIGRNACISQRAFLCTGSHDWSDIHFRLITAPITVKNGAWICANVFVGPGVTIGTNAVATAGSVVTQSLPPGMICSGNPCVPVKERRLLAD
jgi:putative colanic acid biosynthesis acetyltransferase WcaF